MAEDISRWPLAQRCHTSCPPRVGFRLPGFPTVYSLRPARSRYRVEGRAIWPFVPPLVALGGGLGGGVTLGTGAAFPTRSHPSFEVSHIGSSLLNGTAAPFWILLFPVKHIQAAV